MKVLTYIEIYRTSILLLYAVIFRVTLLTEITELFQKCLIEIADIGLLNQDFCPVLALSHTAVTYSSAADV